MKNNNPTFFIGYDSKEDIAYRVCKQSLLKNSSIKISVLSLKLYELISKKYYKRSIDPLASTEFTYSRFLVPFLKNYSGWAVFCDCDFIFLKMLLTYSMTYQMIKLFIVFNMIILQVKNIKWMDNSKQFIQEKIGQAL